MILYPAIDVFGGKVVRLRQGEYDDSTVYGVDPVAMALSFVDQGATWVHMVDLDAARSGEPVNRSVIASVARAIAGRASLQVGGGVRTEADAEALAAAGVTRVVMGSGCGNLLEVAARVLCDWVGAEARPDSDSRVRSRHGQRARRLLLTGVGVRERGSRDIPHVELCRADGGAVGHVLR